MFGASTAQRRDSVAFSDNASAHTPAPNVDFLHETEVQLLPRAPTVFARPLSLPHLPFLTNEETPEGYPVRER